MDNQTPYQNLAALVLGFQVYMNLLNKAVRRDKRLTPFMTELLEAQKIANDKSNKKSDKRILEINSRDDVGIIFGIEELDYNDGIFDDKKSYRLFILQRFVVEWDGVLNSLERDYPWRNRSEE